MHSHLPLATAFSSDFLSYVLDEHPSPLVQPRLTSALLVSSRPVSPSALISFDGSSTGLMREDARRLHRGTIDLYDRLGAARRAGRAQLSLYRTTIEFRSRENRIARIPRSLSSTCSLRPVSPLRSRVFLTATDRERPPGRETRFALGLSIDSSARRASWTTK